MADRLTPVLDAIVTQIAALGLAVGGVTLPVLIRQAAVRRLGMDPPAMITVAKSATPEQTKRRRFGLWQTAYVIDVIVHGPHLPPETRTSDYSTIRDSIVDVLKKPPLAGAPDVFEMDAAPADWLRPWGEGGAQYDWQSLQITATVAHA